MLLRQHPSPSPLLADQRQPLHVLRSGHSGYSSGFSGRRQWCQQAPSIKTAICAAQAKHTAKLGVAEVLAVRGSLHRVEVECCYPSQSTCTRRHERISQWRQTWTLAQLSKDFQRSWMQLGTHHPSLLAAVSLLSTILPCASAPGPAPPPSCAAARRRAAAAAAAPPPPHCCSPPRCRSLLGRWITKSAAQNRTDVCCRLAAGLAAGNRANRQPFK